MPNSQSLVIKRSVVIHGHKSSVSLEEPFWTSLKDIARLRGQTLTDLVSGIDSTRAHNNLSSSLRIFVLEYYRGVAGNNTDQTGDSCEDPAPRALISGR